MITEDYVSFEVAKLLKEKGFNEYCLKNYWSSDKELHDWKWELSYNRNSDGNGNTKDCAAPTQQMAIKWLREKQIYIRIIEDAFGESYHFEVYSKNPNVKINYYVPNYYKDTYEDAVEAALKYCLENLI